MNDERNGQGFDRRQLLIGGLGALGGITVLGSSAAAKVRLFGPSASNGGDDAPHTLLLLQLTGGNDALSMVAPYGDDGYNSARSSIRINANEVIKLDDYRGLNPGLKGLKSLWDDRRMAIVEGCGYPNPIRSHFKSYEMWHTASDKGRLAGEGWVGKLCDGAWPKDETPELVVHLGQTAPYSVYSATHPALTFQTPASYRWVGPESEDMQAYRKAAEEDAQELEKQRKKDSGRDAMIKRLRGVLEDATESSNKIRRAAANYEPKVKYPDDEFGESLRIAASLIDARVGSRVISLELGGFDTHQNQRQRHDQLMRQLDAGVTAFVNDMKGTSAGDNVIVMTVSEFGRRVKENGSRGTDHGVAAPMLVLGTKVKGGLYGKHPSLTDLDDGDLKFTTDFRSVYGTVIETWFGADHSKVLGAKYPLIPLVA